MTFDRRRFLLGALAGPAVALLGGADPSRTPGARLPEIPPVDETLEALLAGTPEAAPQCAPLFPSFFLGGFESASHLRDGVHLDLIGATAHDRFAELDYVRLSALGIRACRDAVTWPVSEPRPGRYDFSRALGMARAAKRVGMQVNWGLMHYGWPADLDVYSTAFPGRFAAYAKAFLRTLVDEGLAEPDIVISPVNEISFLAWAGGDAAMLNPYQREHSFDLKYQLARAAIEGMRAMREVLPTVRFMHTDPLMQVTPRSDRPRERETAEDIRAFQFQAMDMMIGRTWGPQLGGSPDLIDILGLNYYRDNQRYLDGELIDGTDPKYRPLSDMLLEVARRYGKPMILAETGAEEPDRSRWLRYVCVESARAMRAGCPLHAITWYPIVNHPGWADDRHVHNGLWDYPDPAGWRVRHEPLAREILAATGPMTALRDRTVLGAAGCTLTADGSAPPSRTRP